MKLKFKNKHIIGLWGMLMSISFAVRCNPNLLFGKNVIEYLLLILLTLCSVLFNYHNLFTKKILFCDIFMILSIFFIFSNLEITKYSVIIFLSILFYFIIQNHYLDIRYVEYALIIFSIFTACVATSVCAVHFKIGRASCRERV